MHSITCLVPARWRFAAVVIAAATGMLYGQQVIRSRAFAPGSCGPVDAAYIRTAEDTGGMPVFFQRSEVAQSTRFMLAASSQNHVTLLWAKGTLQNEDREFSVPVDSTLEFVLFALSVDDRNTKMDAFGPDHAPLDGSRAEITDFTCGRYLMLKRPPPGVYRVRVRGSGRFWISVGGKSDIFLHQAQFVERGGRPGHEGMFPIHGQPLAGRPANLEAGLSGDIMTASFALVTPENRTIKTLDLSRLEAERDEHDYAGAFALPNEPFRLVATGVDQQGYRFQRVYEGLFRPTTLALALVTAPDLIAGKTATFTFKATNLGRRDSFRVLAVCASGWPVHIDRSEISLAAEESATLKVSIAVPDNTPAYTGGDLVVTATSESDSSILNGFVQRVSVEPSPPR